MKILLVLALLSLAPSAFACTNFTGDYRTVYMTYFSIRQDGCSQLDINDETGTQHIVLDNVERKIDEYDVYTDNDEILANVQLFKTSSLKDEKWITIEKSIITYRDGEKESEEKRSESFFNDAENLETRTYYPNGEYDTSIDLKY